VGGEKTEWYIFHKQFSNNEQMRNWGMETKENTKIDLPYNRNPGTRTRTNSDACPSFSTKPPG